MGRVRVIMLRLSAAAKRVHIWCESFKAVQNSRKTTGGLRFIVVPDLVEEGEKKEF